MANFKVHILTGAAVGVVLNVVKQSTQISINPKRSFSLGEALAWSAIGATMASLPDLLEPATNPLHRRFFHSLTMVGLVLLLIFGRPAKCLARETHEILRLTGLAYLSHLALDSITPLGLPIW